MRYAEVIGDPVAHSKSPLIHRHWLGLLGLEADYRSTRVPPEQLETHLAWRRTDPEWRGCNVTAPLKDKVLPFLDAGAPALGAVNCVHPSGAGLAGLNTDVDGIAEALTDALVVGRKAVLIGAGGAARAALHVLEQAGASQIVVLARNPAKVEPLRALSPNLEVRPVSDAAEALLGAAVAINASPMGMAHAVTMPAPLLAGLGLTAEDATIFDMVYHPLETPFLAAARAAGRRPVDGLTMLIGQARRSFWLFFGSVPPADCDTDLRCLLLSV